MGNELTKVNNPFVIQKRESGEMTLAGEAETQKAIAEMQASLLIAQKFPRNQRQAMDNILIACQRQTVAENGIYSYSRGGTDIEGASIRLAEVLAQNWGNMAFGIKEISRNENESEMLSYAWDLETNVRQERKFIVKHWRDTKSGGYQIKDERDIYEKTANYGSRRTRACILGIIPADVVDAAMRQCNETLKAKADISEKSIKSMLKMFSVLGVSKEMIEARIQRKIEAITPAQLVQFRKIYNSLKDGLSVIEDWFDISLKPAEANTEKFGGGKDSETPNNEKEDIKKESDQTTSENDTGELNLTEPEPPFAKK